MKHIAACICAQPILGQTRVMHLSSLPQQPPTSPLCHSLSHPCKLKALRGAVALISDLPVVTFRCCPWLFVLQARLLPISSHLAVQDLLDSEYVLPLQGRGAEAPTGSQDDHPAGVLEGDARGAARGALSNSRGKGPPERD